MKRVHWTKHVDLVISSRPHCAALVGDRAQMILRTIDHVQLAMPAGGEARAKAFYEGLLGIPERSGCNRVANRGGCWFIREGLKVHLGVDAEFRPARKAHPAFAVDGLAVLCQRLIAAGHPVESDEPLAGHHRVYIHDPFGNRIELIEPPAIFPDPS
jgi:catechol 2,3-dioxygenase-like lactoylglutathione lyase family enzyme